MIKLSKDYKQKYHNLYQKVQDFSKVSRDLIKEKQHARKNIPLTFKNEIQENKYETYAFYGHLQAYEIILIMMEEIIDE